MNNQCQTGIPGLPFRSEPGRRRAAIPPGPSLALGARPERLPSPGGSARPPLPGEGAQVGDTRLHAVDDLLLPGASTAPRLWGGLPDG